MTSFSGGTDELMLKLGLNSKPAEKEFQGFLKGLEGSASSAKFDDILSGKFNKSFIDTGKANQILNDQKRQEDFNKFNENLKTTGQNITSLGQKMTLFATVPILGGLAYATKEAVEFNSEINNTVRTLDLTKEEAAALSREVLTLAPSLGLLPKEFASVAAEAGKMGVAKEDVAKFGKTLAELATIADTPIDQFVKLGGSIKTVFDLSTEQFDKFGAAVNSLDDKIGGTTPNILDFTSRVGAIGKTIGFTSEQIATFGSVYQKLGFESSAAETGFKNLLQGLFTIQTASPKAKGALESLGFSAEEFGRQMAADPIGMTLKFLDALNAVEDAADRQSKLVLIAGENGISANSALAGSTDLLREALAVAADETENMDKKMREFAGKMRDPAVQSKVLTAQMNALSIQFGTVLIPILGEFLSTITPMIAKFGEWLTLNPQFAKFFVIAATGVAVIGPLVVALGSIITALGVIGPTLGTIIPGFVAFGAWFTTALPAVSAFGGAIVAFVTGIGAIPIAIAGGVAALAAFALNIGGFRDTVLGIAEGLVHKFWMFIHKFLLDWKAGTNETINTLGMVMEVLPQVAWEGLIYLGKVIADGFWAIVTNIPRILWELPGNIYKVFDYVFQGTWKYLDSIARQMEWGAMEAVLKFAKALWELPTKFDEVWPWLSNSVINGLNSVVGLFSEYSSIFYNAGINLIKTFAAGIGNAAGEAYNAVAGVVGNVRQYLPFSPAKTGPLSDLDKSGEAFFNTFAQNLDGQTLMSKIDSVLGSLGLNGTDYQMTPASATGGTQSGGVIINYTQNIEFENKVNAQDVITALKNSQREFLQYLSESQFIINRKQR